MRRCHAFGRLARAAAFLVLASVGSWGALHANAQTGTPGLQPFQATPSPTPAVRRALPVDGDTALTTGAPATARAVPAGSPASSATPHRPTKEHRATSSPSPEPGSPDWLTKVPAAQASPSPHATRQSTAYPKPGTDKPYDPDAPGTSGQSGGVAAPAGAGNDDQSTDIRIAPSGPGQPVVSPDDNQFNLGNDFYDRKEFTQAAAEYERYLGQFPDGTHRQAALWWLGECYRLLKRPAAARSSYQNLVVAFQEGEFVGPAALRLASMDYEDKDYTTALPLFRKSAGLAKNDEVRLISRYYEAVCLEQLNRRDETREVYEEILGVTKDNPYRDDARLALAQMAVSDKHYNEAFKQYEALSREAGRPGLQADASYKAGLLARDLGQNDTASVLYARAIGLPGAGSGVRADAMLAQLHLLYDTNKYKQLLDSYPGMKPALSAAQQPEAMLLAANAQRQLGKHPEARAIYDDILRDYPRSPQAPEARYQRIISLYATNDPGFVKEADDFILGNTEPIKTDQVRLMKADTLFKKGDFDGAALSYGMIDSSNSLPPKYKAEAAYRLGYCYAQARQPEKTVTAFTKFLNSFPEHPFVAKALIQRAVAYQQLKDYPAALKDFNEVIVEHKEAKEREMALEQKALILGQQGDSKSMADTLRTLLKDYPKTEAAGLAHFFIGNSLYEPTKDYEGAAKEFEAARRDDPKEYGARASLMLIRCVYLQLKAEAPGVKDVHKLASEVDIYQKAKLQPGVPPSILSWLGEQEYDAKDYESAERYLTGSTEAAGDKTPETWLMLARARLTLGKYDGALEASEKFLAGSSPEPATRAAGLLAQGEAQEGLKKYEEAGKSVDEALQLQPEGVLNAKARMLGGKISYDQGNYEAAAKSYMSVSVLYDDAEITPEALKQAAQAFEKAGQSAEAKKANDELKSRFPNYASAKVP
jgi:TolA-binding protein